jgi:hypothetical protein
MAEAKVKEVKVEIRDVAYEQVASAIMQDSKLTKLKRHKEGLELVVNGEVVVLRIIKKKAELDSKEWRGEYLLDNTGFRYEALKVAK